MPTRAAFAVDGPNYEYRTSIALLFSLMYCLPIVGGVVAILTARSVQRAPVPISNTAKWSRESRDRARQWQYRHVADQHRNPRLLLVRGNWWTERIISPVPHRRGVTFWPALFFLVFFCAPDRLRLALLPAARPVRFAGRHPTHTRPPARRGERSCSRSCSSCSSAGSS